MDILQDLATPHIQGMAQKLGRSPAMHRDHARRNHRWGVILAGGDRSQLQEPNGRNCADRGQKQVRQRTGAAMHVDALDLDAPHAEATLIRKTWANIAGLIPPDQVLVSRGLRHQPLRYIANLDQDAIVAILPCACGGLDDTDFTTCLEGAFEAASGLELEYGWIEIHPERHPSHWIAVRHLGKTSSHGAAQERLHPAAIWNTFVMVGRVRALLAMNLDAFPSLAEALVEAPFQDGSEVIIPDCAYQSIGAVNFFLRVRVADPVACPAKGNRI